MLVRIKLAATGPQALLQHICSCRDMHDQHGQAIQSEELRHGSGEIGDGMPPLFEIAPNRRRNGIAQAMGFPVDQEIATCTRGGEFIRREVSAGFAPVRGAGDDAGGEKRNAQAATAF